MPSQHAAMKQRVDKVRQKMRIASQAIGGPDWMECFGRHDKSGDGELDFHDFSRCLRTDVGLGTEDVSDQEVMECFADCDADGGGTLDIDEFMDWIQQEAKALPHYLTQTAVGQGRRVDPAQRLKLVNEVKTKLRLASYSGPHGNGGDWIKLFKAYDADGSDDLDFEEFRMALRRDAGLKVTDVPDGELLEVFKVVDADGEGTVDIDEWLQWLGVKRGHHHAGKSSRVRSSVANLTHLDELTQDNRWPQEDRTPRAVGMGFNVTPAKAKNGHGRGVAFPRPVSAPHALTDRKHTLPRSAHISSFASSVPRFGTPAQCFDQSGRLGTAPWHAIKKEPGGPFTTNHEFHFRYGDHIQTPEKHVALRKQRMQKFSGIAGSPTPSGKKKKKKKKKKEDAAHRRLKLSESGAHVGVADGNTTITNSSMQSDARTPAAFNQQQQAEEQSQLRSMQVACARLDGLLDRTTEALDSVSANFGEEVAAQLSKSLSISASDLDGSLPTFAPPPESPTAVKEMARSLEERANDLAEQAAQLRQQAALAAGESEPAAVEAEPQMVPVVQAAVQAAAEEVAEEEEEEDIRDRLDAAIGCNDPGQVIRVLNDAYTSKRGDLQRQILSLRAYGGALGLELPEPPAPKKSPKKSPSKASKKQTDHEKQMKEWGESIDLDTMHEIFTYYNGFGSGSSATHHYEWMTNSKFHKLFKDAKIVKGHGRGYPTSGDLDTLFTKTLRKSTATGVHEAANKRSDTGLIAKPNSLSFGGFMTAVRVMACRLFLDLSDGQPPSKQNIHEAQAQLVDKLLHLASRAHGSQPKTKAPKPSTASKSLLDSNKVAFGKIFNFYAPPMQAHGSMGTGGGKDMGFEKDHRSPNRRGSGASSSPARGSLVSVAEKSEPHKSMTWKGAGDRVKGALRVQHAIGGHTSSGINPRAMMVEKELNERVMTLQQFLEFAKHWDLGTSKAAAGRCFRVAAEATHGVLNLDNFMKCIWICALEPVSNSGTLAGIKNGADARPETADDRHNALIAIIHRLQSSDGYEKMTLGGSQNSAAGGGLGRRPSVSIASGGPVFVYPKDTSAGGGGAPKSMDLLDMLLSGDGF